MRRTTVMLPDELDARLRFWAARRGVSVAELVREAVEARYGGPAGPRALSFAGIGQPAPGTPPDLARRHEELLGEALRRDDATSRQPPDADR
jgi:hypothetical protein